MEVIVRILPVDPNFQVDKIKLDQVIELVFRTVRQQYHERFQNKQSPFVYREEELTSYQIDQEIKRSIFTEVRDQISVVQSSSFPPYEFIKGKEIVNISVDCPVCKADLTDTIIEKIKLAKQDLLYLRNKLDIYCKNCHNKFNPNNLLRDVAYFTTFQIELPSIIFYLISESVKINLYDQIEKLIGTDTIIQIDHFD